MTAAAIAKRVRAAGNRRMGTRAERESKVGFIRMDTSATFEFGTEINDATTVVR